MIRDNDTIKPLVDYIEKNLKKGHKLDNLRWALVNQKYSRIEIEKAIKIVEARTPSARKEEPRINIQEVKQEEIALPQKKGFWRRVFGRD